MKLAIVGHLAKNEAITDGQTIKTRNTYNELKKIYGDKEIYLVDTYKWKKNPFKLFLNCLTAIKKADNILILPARNGIKTFVPLFSFLNRFYKRKMYYIVVGGWLPEFLLEYSNLIKPLRKFNEIFVETKGMKDKLNDLNLENIDVMFNFKDLEILREDCMDVNIKCPFRVCTFSRVIKEKGIENAINAVTLLNQKFGKTIYYLDIYGPIGIDYEEEFNCVMEKTEKFIQYKGVVDSKKSIDVIKKYDFLLFPTYYDGEGFAGTIIDAFSAGVPVIASDWKYNIDIISPGENGFIFPTKCDDRIVEILENIYQNKYNVLSLKKNCLKEAKKYIPKEAIKSLTIHLDEER